MAAADGWHVRVNACNAEASAANQERALPTTPDRRGAALFAYAECERTRLAAQPVTVDSLPDYAEDLNHARGLYWEAFRTHERRWEIGAFARIGDLFAVAARKVEPLKDAAHVQAKFDEQAEQAWRWAMIHADGAPAEVLATQEVVDWLDAACRGLTEAAVRHGESPSEAGCSLR
jgi:hypothetical protein